MSNDATETGAMALRMQCMQLESSTIAELLGEEAAVAYEARIEAIREQCKDAELQSKEISAAMQDSDETILGRRVYHEAPNDVFELIVKQSSENYEDGDGGLNALRQVSKRCLRVVESVATRLTLFDDAVLLPFAALKRCKMIEHIQCHNLKSLEGCPEGLKRLSINDGQHFKSLESLSACKELETLKISRAPQMSALSPLSSCTRLKTLIINRSKVTDLTPLLSMPLLEEVDFAFCSINEVSPLSHCKRLQKLFIGNNDDIEDLSPLCQCPDLEELSISWLPLIKDLSFLEKGFTKLRVLHISLLPVDDLSPVTRLQNLEELYCWGIPQTTSLLPLAKCYKLQKIRCHKISMDLTELLEKRLDIVIHP
jgi:hypothetical protein